MNEITPMIKQLLVANIIFFVATNFLGNSAYLYDLLALHNPDNPLFRFWQPLTHMFMHAPMPNLSHLFFNMFGLFSFGTMLERRWGGNKFLFFYITCGFGAALLHGLINYYEFYQPLQILISNGFEKSQILQVINRKEIITSWENILTPTEMKSMFDGYYGSAVGASGALYGVIVAFAFLFPNAEMGIMFVPIPFKVKYFVPVLVAFDLFSGVTGYSIFGGGNIAHFAHVGGAICGFLFMMVWRNKQFDHKRWN